MTTKEKEPAPKEPAKPKEPPKPLGQRLPAEARELLYLDVLKSMFATYRTDGRKASGPAAGIAGDFARAVEAADTFMVELDRLER